MTRLSDHFTLAEMTASATAARRGLNNTPPMEVVDQLILTADRMEKVRALLGDKPIRVSSGYRSAAVNAAVGGSKTSAHMTGHAVDFTCPEFGTPHQVAHFLAQALKAQGIAFDQLILEFGDWVHIGWGPQTRGQVLTARKAGGKTAYDQSVAPVALPKGVLPYGAQRPAPKVEAAEQLPRLAEAERALIHEEIYVQKMAGSASLAAALQLLLTVHDRAHERLGAK